MKKVFLSLVLVGALSIGINVFSPLHLNNPLINANIVIAAEDMKMDSDMDMGNQHDSEVKDSHDADANEKQEMNMSNNEMKNMTDEEMNNHDNGTSHEEESGGHGHEGNSEYTPPNQIFLITILSIMIISIVVASIIRHRRGRVENESTRQAIEQ